MVKITCKLFVVGRQTSEAALICCLTMQLSFLHSHAHSLLPLLMPFCREHLGGSVCLALSYEDIQSHYRDPPLLPAAEKY